MRKIWVILAALILAGCSQEPVTPAPEKLVIEGWIEDGGAPVVYVTSTLKVTEGEVVGADAIESHIVKWAKVTISDGTESVVLTGTASSRFYPPYAYTTGRMFGKVGTTYTITVEYSGEVATASAAIPPPAELDDIQAVPEGDTGEYVIRVNFTDNPATEDYYRFFMRINDVDKTYLPAPVGTVSDAQISSGAVQLELQPGASMFRTERRTGFRSGETVSVKFCTMERSMYMYWNAFEEQYNLTDIPFFSLDSNLPGNVSGGIGYFAAYGSSTYTVTIP